MRELFKGFTVGRRRLRMQLRMYLLPGVRRAHGADVSELQGRTGRPAPSRAARGVAAILLSVVFFGCSMPKLTLGEPIDDETSVVSPEPALAPPDEAVAAPDLDNYFSGSEDASVLETREALLEEFAAQREEMDPAVSAPVEEQVGIVEGAIVEMVMVLADNPDDEGLRSAILGTVRKEIGMLQSALLKGFGGADDDSE